MRHAFTLVVLTVLGALLPSSAQAPQSGSDVWQTIRNHLQTLDGQHWFDLVMKDAVAPNPPELWEGTVLSGDPVDAPTRLVVGFGDSFAPEITLTLLGKGDKPAALKQSVRSGTKVKFRGVAESFKADPFMVILTVWPEDRAGPTELIIETDEHH